MYQGTRGAVSLAVMSLSVWGCTLQGGDEQQQPAYKIEYLDADADMPDAAGESPPAADSGSTADSGATPSCAADDQSCDGVDDDCDGKVDEDFQARCVFGAEAVVCIDGVATGQRCDDSDVCTVDSCGTNGCKHTPISCDDGDACTADSCDPQLGCENPPALGAPCDDGDACTAGDTCDAAASCQAGTPIDFDDHDPCTADACDPLLGVSHVAMPGVACEDGDACTQGEVCTAAGSCEGGTPLDLDDGNPCTVDACDPALGVSHAVALGTACDDGNACSEADACAADGSCTGRPLPGLNDADACTTDTCDPVSGAITHTRLEPGASCSDGDACNGMELCQAAATELTAPIEAHQTFLRSDPSDTVSSPTIIRLSDYGFGPGRRVRVYTVGRYSTPNQTRGYGVFSRDSRLLDRDQVERVPGAIQSDAPAIVTSATWINRLPTDIAQDFRTDDAGIELTIPEGAHYLFLGYFDSLYNDNSGALQLVMRALAPDCVGGEPPLIDDGNACTADACDATAGVTHSPVDAGVACMAAAGAAGGCDGAGSCVACSAQPALCD
jgi:hypothetical protein